MKQILTELKGKLDNPTIIVIKIDKSFSQILIDQLDKIVQQRHKRHVTLSTTLT